jgi:hypothetical protein
MRLKVRKWGFINGEGGDIARKEDGCGEFHFQCKKEGGVLSKFNAFAGLLLTEGSNV